MLSLLVLAYRGETLVVVNMCWYIPPDCLPNHTASPSACSRLPVQNARSRCLWKGLETPLLTMLQNVSSTTTYHRTSRCTCTFLVWETDATPLWSVGVEGRGVETGSPGHSGILWTKVAVGEENKERVLPFISSLSRTCRAKGKFCSMIWIVELHSGLFLVKLHKIKFCLFLNHHVL